MSLADTTQQISYRDAYDRVSQYTHSEKGAIKLLETAIVAGDDNLVKAVTAYSKTQGWNVSPDVHKLAADTHEAFIGLLEDFDAGTRPIRENIVSKRISDEYGREQLNAGKWTGKLDVIVARAQSIIGASQAKYAAAIKRLTTPQGSVQDQLLTEMRTGRAWDRIRQELDAQVKDGNSASMALTDRLRNTTDPYEMSALLAEGPSYLTTHGERDSASVINQVLNNVDPVVSEASTNVHLMNKFEVVLRYDERIIRAIITNTNLNVVSDINPYTEGYVNPTTVQY